MSLARTVSGQGRAVVRVHALFRQYPPTPVMLAFNQSVIGAMLGPVSADPRRGELGCRSRLIANRYHLARVRITLLAAAYSDRPGRRIASSFFWTVRVGSAQVVCEPSQPENPASRCALQAVRAGGARHASVHSLASQPVRLDRDQRSSEAQGHAAYSSASQGQSCDLAEICPEDPVERFGGVSAPVPIGRRVFAL